MTINQRIEGAMLPSEVEPFCAFLFSSGFSNEVAKTLP
jgi:hypothetical protein